MNDTPVTTIPLAATRYADILRGARPLLSLRLLVHVILLRPLLRILFRARVDGASCIASLDQFVLVANHNSHLDTPLLYLALPISRIASTRPVAALDYFSKHRFLLAVANFLFRPVWIDRSAHAGTTMERIVRAIDAGESLILFPEGSRGRPGEFGNFKSSVGWLLRQRPWLQAVPAFLAGTWRALPRGVAIPRFASLHVSIGTPRAANGSPLEITRLVRGDIEALARPPLSGSNDGSDVRTRPIRIAVIGIDGCGKSTLSRQLAERLSTTSTTCLVGDKLEFFERGRCVPRPLPRLERARQWIGARARRAGSLSRYKVPKLVELLLRDRIARGIGRRGEADVIVMDGCPLVNLLGWAALYHERRFDQSACSHAMTFLTSGTCREEDVLLERFPELAVLKRLRLNRFRLPDATVLLDIDPEQAMRRIGSRAGRRQIHENATSLNKLRSAYLTVHGLLESHPETAACRLDAAVSLDALADEALRLTTDMRSHCHG
jgi:1-acyl-sn-glycerol-3-phosphate acyltransferase